MVHFDKAPIHEPQQPTQLYRIIGGIPHELRSNKALCNFFNELFDDVDDVNIALRIDELDELTKKSDDLELKLEHAVNVFTATGKRPMHSDRILFGTKVDSIDTFREDLAKLSAENTSTIAHLEHEYSKHEASMSGLPVQSPASDAAAAGPPPPPVALDGAFVTFHSLRSASAAQQALHHAAPFGLWVVGAPLPQHVCWANVGLSHASAQLGALASGALTAALCLLWTVPVAVVASFSRVDSLKRTFPFLQSAPPTPAPSSTRCSRRWRPWRWSCSSSSCPSFSPSSPAWRATSRRRRCRRPSS